MQQAWNRAHLTGEGKHVVAIVDSIWQPRIPQPVAGPVEFRALPPELALQLLAPPHGLQLGHRRDRTHVGAHEADVGQPRLLGVDDEVLRRQRVVARLGLPARQEGKLLPVASGQHYEVSLHAPGAGGGLEAHGAFLQARDAALHKVDVLADGLHGPVPDGPQQPLPPRRRALGPASQERHAARGLVDDVLAALVPGHVVALPDPLVEPVGATSHQQEAEARELRRHPPVHAHALGPLALPGVGGKVHDDAVEGRQVLAEVSWHRHEPVARAHRDALRAVRRRRVPEIERSLARAHDQHPPATEQLWILVGGAVQDLAPKVLLAGEARHAWGVVQARAHCDGIPLLDPRLRAALTMQRHLVSSGFAAQQIQHARFEPDQRLNAKVGRVVPQIDHIVDEGHMYLGFWLPEVRKAREVLARDHASVLVGLVLEGAADCAARLDDTHLVPTLA
mmetsp:Transcript_102074/g.284162  ORF Transcript_102074/g.284162 Transcript_102074/m.284162 type:complete len:450 (-) Transcript_102074:186-1535(-)